ncbi:uncharacterized protein LOC129587398 [Paramacrobiotus metropolitanus]|uniref:uncharacterized protein LOC129587398 n=1 Tax=Paramacrobiotus metropolitanus TaxID=2943436 RepID=UPI002445BEFC|nr:uncharacterized protein LOC129587398 [Paramacrobiotus metropolitanus]
MAIPDFPDEFPCLKSTLKRLHDFYYERVAGAPDNSLDSGFFEGDPSDEAESDLGDENEEEGEHVLADDTLESEPATEAEEGEIDAIPETEAEEELDDTLLVGDIDLDEYLNGTEPVDTVEGGNKRKHSDDDDDNDTEEPPAKKQETEMNTQN